MMHLLLILAPLAQTVPARPDSPEGLRQVPAASSPLQAPALGELPTPAAPEADLVPETQPVEPDGTVPIAPELEPELEPVEEPPASVPEPWHVPESDEARQGMLGPWPDDFQPQSGRLEMLPTVDPVTGRVLDAGTPMEGELQGPQAALPAPPQELPAEPTPLLETPSSALEGTPTEPVQPSPAAPALAPVLKQEPAQVIKLWPFEPPKGGQSLSRAVIWFLVATVAVLTGRRMDAARGTLPKRGVLPALAQVTKVISRIAALIAVGFGCMRLVPDAYFQYFPVVLVAASVAVGWSARDVLHDVLAGILLVVEHRLVPDMRVEADGRVGTVINVGFRSVSMESDDGQIIRIPNRDFLSTDTRVDKDPYAPVEVAVEAPHGARRRLEEIALASPLVAPGHPPEVFRDPEHPERWVVRARLVHPRWALAFRGAVQDRLEAG